MVKGRQQKEKGGVLLEKLAEADKLAFARLSDQRGRLCLMISQDGCMPEDGLSMLRLWEVVWLSSPVFLQL